MQRGSSSGSIAAPVGARQQASAEAAYQPDHLVDRAGGDDAASGPHDGAPGALD